MPVHFERPVTVSAPGSIMLTGEHVVVYGGPAIVAAIEQRVTVAVAPLDAPVLSVTSDIADPETTPLESLTAEGVYRFVKAAVLCHMGRIKQGLSITITSKIDPTLGLGSSAAVTVAVLAALAGHVRPQIHADALRIIRDIQGRGSGADLAASLWGGVQSYQIDGDGPAQVRALPLPPPLSLFNVGYKTPTGEVLAKVAAAQAVAPETFKQIYHDMGQVAATTITAFDAEDWVAVGQGFADFQALMAALGVSDTALESAIAKARATDGVHGAKISGSGLGDCVVAMGAVPQEFTPVKLAKEGVIFHDS